MPKATIALIEGIARGGGSELVLSFDMRFAALGKARLAQPEVGIGITPAAAEPSGCPGLSVGDVRWRSFWAATISTRPPQRRGDTSIGRCPRRTAGLRRRARRADRLVPVEVVAAAKRAVDAAVGDPTPGLRVEDQLFRGTLAGPGPPKECRRSWTTADRPARSNSATPL